MALFVTTLSELELRHVPFGAESDGWRKATVAATDEELPHRPELWLRVRSSWSIGAVAYDIGGTRTFNKIPEVERRMTVLEATPEEGKVYRFG